MRLVKLYYWIFRFYTLALVLLIAACNSPPELSAQQKDALIAQTTKILESVSMSGPVSEESWGAPIKSLKPKDVFINDSGLYIKTGSGFVNEYGLFVLS